MQEIRNTAGNLVGKCGHEGIKIDLGAGRRRDPDKLGIDITAGGYCDRQRNLANGLPFCDRSVVEIKAHNILEHLGEEFDFVMQECWRVMQDGGILDILVPGAMSDGGMRDPTHKRHFMKSTFDYFTPHRPKYHSYMDGFKWTVLELTGENDGTICVKMTPLRETPKA